MEDNNEQVAMPDAELFTVHLKNRIFHFFKKGKMKYKDISGQKFNLLTAISPVLEKPNKDGMMWNCICDCGNYKIIKGSALRDSSIKSCGCLLKEYHYRKKSEFKEQMQKEIGKQYHNLKILDILFDKKLTEAKILCFCGKEFITNWNSVKTYRRKSCGCLKKQKYNEIGRNLYERYKNSALKRNYEFSLTLDNFVELTSDKCYYCHIDPKQIHGKNHKIPYVYNGIDRVDNDFGYTVENCVTACGKCNILKRDINFNIIQKSYQVLNQRSINMIFDENQKNNLLNETEILFETHIKKINYEIFAMKRALDVLENASEDNKENKITLIYTIDFLKSSINLKEMLIKEGKKWLAEELAKQEESHAQPETNKED